LRPSADYNDSDAGDNALHVWISSAASYGFAICA
jgi:hypothetical protein